MATTGFGICLVLSILILLYMGMKNYENINIYDWSIMLLIPVVILGYWLKTRVITAEAAQLAFCFIYLDSSLLLILAYFSMLHSFGIRVRWWQKAIGYGAAFAHAAVVWLSFGTNLYYAGVTVVQTDAGSVTKMTDGPLKIVHVIYLLLLVTLIIGTIVGLYIKKGTHSRMVLYNYSFVAVLFVLVYAIEVLVDVDFSLLPYLYVVGSGILVVTYDLEHMHDISCVISQQQKYYSAHGYVVLDLKQHFMSCNEKAYEFEPFLKEQRVDDALPKNVVIFRQMIEAFARDHITSKKITDGEKTYVYEIAEFTMRRDGQTKGYLFDIRDATEEQKAIDVMEEYNQTLSEEIDKKTRNIVDIQKKVTLGMANIIDNRDNNTGGHVKRTSDIIDILVDEMMTMKHTAITKQMADDIVRAAPLHDLGKISIDSTILCKPARLTDEEFAIMKTHSVKSGELVHILLDGVEEQRFVDTAFHIARFHHERWDGRGYPEGLVGSMIPIEARIMAIADVYDALVSKRCYKEPMSYEKACEIMLEGMGTQFDPNLRRVFLACKDRLEAYYSET